MKTTQDIVEELLLEGKHINKFDLLNVANSVCLPQRILDIRQTKNWNISSKSVKGKGTLREYWLEPAEIARIKGEKEYVETRDDGDEQLHFGATKSAPKAQKQATEQLGIGLLGGHNY